METLSLLCFTCRREKSEVKNKYLFAGGKKSRLNNIKEKHFAASNTEITPCRHKYASSIFSEIKINKLRFNVLCCHITCFMFGPHSIFDCRLQMRTEKSHKFYELDERYGIEFWAFQEKVIKRDPIAN
ncbi:CLUMA_CG013755, isoform A [Clunio marinus]|uniref:CLUMA_CG013755, isoform A n=1 Tax=Clunio marinus TaxID=568069 RepID=A0A1J1IN23_9DIPT|nr:CLUMA_CG013755, isoform A [Clunio marinus]